MMLCRLCLEDANAGECEHRWMEKGSVFVELSKAIKPPSTAETSQWRPLVFGAKAWFVIFSGDDRQPEKVLVFWTKMNLIIAQEFLQRTILGVVMPKKPM